MSQYITQIDIPTKYLDSHLTRIVTLVIYVLEYATFFLTIGMLQNTYST